MVGWLRAMEVFPLNHGDVSVCDPGDGTRYSLCPAVGLFLLRLLPTTKSSPYATADVVLADTYALGLSPLKAWKAILPYFFLMVPRATLWKRNSIHLIPTA